MGVPSARGRSEEWRNERRVLKSLEEGGTAVEGGEGNVSGAGGGGRGEVAER